MMVKTKLLIILFVLIAKVSYSQDTSYQYLDILVSDFIEELQANHIDTVCIYKDYCVGCVHVFDTENDRCDYSSIYIPTYILWLNQGKFFLTKKDNCFDYSIIEINFSYYVWKLFFKNKKRIRKEKVKPFEYTVIDDKKKEKHLIMMDHSKHRDFKMIVNGNITALNFDEFDLEKEYDGSTNINYLHNQNLKGKEIIDELRRIVQHIENEKLLAKNRR
jgi:hypothetical protein